jgi:hypothetical protein
MFSTPRLWALALCFSTWLPSIVTTQGSDTSYFFSNGTFYPSTTLSAACSNAILGEVNCLDDLLTYAHADTFYPLGNATYQQQFCSASCGSSLATYVSNVTSACAGQPEPFDGLPATYYGNWAWSTWNLTCLQDAKTGEYCIGNFSPTTKSSQDFTHQAQITSSASSQTTPTQKPLSPKFHLRNSAQIVCTSCSSKCKERHTRLTMPILLPTGHRSSLYAAFHTQQQSPRRFPPTHRSSPGMLQTSPIRPHVFPETHTPP